MRQLHYFPESLPNETLLSRVSRYHLLSGECTDEHTWRSLFALPPDQVSFTNAAPVGLRRLAKLLPGNPKATFEELLASNTFVPLVTKVMTSIDWQSADPSFGEARTCLACANEDQINSSFGLPYIRRSHQLPGVTACWMHAIKLIDNCPECGSKFKRPGRFLASPIVPCTCGWSSGVRSQSIDATATEHNFAVKAHHVFERRVLETPATELTDFFDFHICQKVFGRKRGLGPQSSLAVEIVEQFGKNVSTEELALALSRLIHSGRAPDCWVANLNPGIHAKRLLKLTSRDNPIVTAKKPTYTRSPHQEPSRRRGA